MSDTNPTQVSFSASLTVLLILVSTFAQAQPQRSIYQAQGNYLILEISDEDLIHLEYGRGPAPSPATPLPTTDI